MIAPGGLPLTQLELPKTDGWKDQAFAPMKVTFKRAPCLAPDEPSFQPATAPPWNREVWSMTLKTTGGVEVMISELGKDLAARREEWFKEQTGAQLVPGELVFQDESAIVKRARVMGKKSAGELPELSKEAANLAACKKLDETFYCIDLSGDVQLAMAKATVTPEDAMQLLAMLRSLQRPKK